MWIIIHSFRVVCALLKMSSAWCDARKASVAAKRMSEALSEAQTTRKRCTQLYCVIIKILRRILVFV